MNTRNSSRTEGDLAQEPPAIVSGMEQAIRLGKIIMKNSLDPGHGYAHAKRVEESSIRIFHEFKEKYPEKATGITQGMVSIVAWWHDAYKALRVHAKLSDQLIEGRESAKLARKELEMIVQEKQLLPVLYAIHNHHKNIKFRLFLNKVPLLLRIILEADGLEIVHKGRFKMVCGQLGWGFHRVLHVAVYMMGVVFYKFYPMSQYGRNKYNRQRKQKLIAIQ